MLDEFESLIPLFPIDHRPDSPCPHHGPIPDGSRLCCMCCHSSGMDKDPRVKNHTYKFYVDIDALFAHEVENANEEWAWRSFYERIGKPYVPRPMPAYIENALLA